MPSNTISYKVPSHLLLQRAKKVSTSLFGLLLIIFALLLLAAPKGFPLSEKIVLLVLSILVYSAIVFWNIKRSKNDYIVTLDVNGVSTTWGRKMKKYDWTNFSHFTPADSWQQTNAPSGIMSFFLPTLFLQNKVSTGVVQALGKHFYLWFKRTGKMRILPSITLYTNPENSLLVEQLLDQHLPRKSSAA